MVGASRPARFRAGAGCGLASAHCGVVCSQGQEAGVIAPRVISYYINLEKLSRSSFISLYISERGRSNGGSHDTHACTVAHRDRHTRADTVINEVRQEAAGSMCLRHENVTHHENRDTSDPCLRWARSVASNSCLSCVCCGACIASTRGVQARAPAGSGCT